MSLMFYKNKLKIKKPNSKIINFDNFAENINSDLCSENLKEAGKISYNYQNTSGTLESEIGFTELALPISDGSLETRIIRNFNDTDVKKLWHFKYFDHVYNCVADKIIFCSADGRLSVLSVFDYDKNSYILDIEAFGNLPVGINYCIEGEDFMLFSGGGSLVAYTSRRLPIYNENCPPLLSICKAYDNIFAILAGDRNKLLYTPNTNPLALSDTNEKMDLTGEAGRLCSLINFDDYLFIFREFGITKLSKYGSADNFSISEIYQSSARIYENTISVCGNEIIFLAQDGIYKFSGTNTEKIKLNIDKFFDGIANNDSSACYSKGKYILACRLNFGDEREVGCETYADGFKNNAIIILDLNSKKFSIMRGLDISSLLSLNAGSLSTILATFNGEHSKKIGIIDTSASIFDTELNCLWQSGKFDFGEFEKLKIIKKIFIKTKENCKITLKSDIEQKIFTINAGPSTQCINTKLKGKVFEVSISSNGKTHISNFKLKADIE